MTTSRLKTLGEYELCELLRSVAQTEYFLGRHSSAGEKVIIKTSPLRPGTQEFDRMALELRVLAALKSDFVAPLLDAGHDAGVLFAVFPYYSGTISDPSLDYDNNIGLVADAALGAHHLHEAGIVHRNIEPRSIHLSEGRGVLTDLGMLRSLNPSEATMTVGPIGSPQYSDPDLLAGSHRGSRYSDIWSLGATLHYLLTSEQLVGDLPDGAVQEVLRARLRSKICIDDQLTPTMAAIIRACVDPTNRYGTAKALSDDLNRIRDSSQDDSRASI